MRSTALEQVHRANVLLTLVKIPHGQSGRHAPQCDGRRRLCGLRYPVKLRLHWNNCLRGCSTLHDCPASRDRRLVTRELRVLQEQPAFDRNSFRGRTHAEVLESRRYDLFTPTRFR